MKATEKQIIAIKNLMAWLKTGEKTNHKCLTKSELKEFSRFSIKEADWQIKFLIGCVKEREMDILGGPSELDFAW